MHTEAYEQLARFTAHVAVDDIVRSFIGSRTARVRLEDSELPAFIDDWPRGLRPASVYRCADGVLLRYDAPSARHAEVFVHGAGAETSEGWKPRVELLAHTVDDEPAQRLLRALRHRLRTDERATRRWLDRAG